MNPFSSGSPRRMTQMDGALFLLMGVIVVVMVLAVFKQDLRVHAEGAWAQGRVVRKEVRARSRLSSGRDYVLHYGFTRQGGGWRTDQRNVSKDLYERLRAGSEIQVLYDRDDPSHSYPEGEGGIPLVLVALAFVMAGGLGITGLVIMLRKGTAEEDFLA
ncbi:DUF3592 domain-containing protein [Corallococcus exercitus]|uniref:DUF3592 domain-containing protein n=1 Tax=Corallococcus exercitus TaxID=2316736 RepID=A0A7Y4NPF8_9BACT|nr:DUF3592 domain-containing protein [Corallococcus exercitus]NOK32465.1 DUF3592 domain-containing protein [Corallococcus exercitus]